MKSKNLLDSFNNAINGFLGSIKTERNMRVHLLAAAIIVLLSLFYNITHIEFMIIAITISLVIICELFNTAMEAFVDALIEVYHPKAKIVKDTTAAAVFVSAIMSLAVAYLIFFDRVSSDLEIGIVRLKHTPMHLTVIAVAVTVVIVILIKAFTKKGTPLRGGMPSGHAAVAMSLTTAVALLSENSVITLIVLAISLLVIQSRFEAKFHTILELILGAILGFGVTLLLFLTLYTNS